MDKASDFESEDCEFESRRGRIILLIFHDFVSSKCAEMFLMPKAHQVTFSICISHHGHVIVGLRHIRNSLCTVRSNG